MKRIEVYLAESGCNRRLGTLEYEKLRGKEVASFELEEEFIRNPSISFLGPDIGLFHGKQYPQLSYGFGMFQDAAPDSWGRKIIRRREKSSNLRESDFLLGVFDLTRLGALRFKVEGNEDFVNIDGDNPAPPWTTLRTLEDCSRRFELDNEDEMALAILLRPGTSLGGARPKASITAPDGSLWMAKFPSRDDTIDIGAWEYLIHLLAVNAGIDVPEAKAQKFSKTGTTFLCRRFDREGKRRIHFASAMTMLGCEDRQEENNGTYFDIVEFLIQHGSKPDKDLPELWRRIAFSLLVSNTDDHLRNHGFIVENGKWRLSPAYDLNANLKRPYYLSLELDSGMPIESVDTLFEVADYFRLNEKSATEQFNHIKSAVSEWRTIAAHLGISRREQDDMAICFRTEE